MPVYPNWMGNTLGTLGAQGGMTQPVQQTLAGLGDSFGDRFGQWVPGRTPVAGLPTSRPEGFPGSLRPDEGWSAGLGPANAPGAVPYTNPALAAQQANTNPAELVRQDDSPGFSLAKFLANFDFKPAPIAPQAAPFSFASRFAGLQPLQRGAGIRGFGFSRPPTVPT